MIRMDSTAYLNGEVTRGVDPKTPFVVVASMRKEDKIYSGCVGVVTNYGPKVSGYNYVLWLKGPSGGVGWDRIDVLDKLKVRNVRNGESVVITFKER